MRGSPSLILLATVGCGDGTHAPADLAAPMQDATPDLIDPNCPASCTADSEPLFGPCSLEGHMCGCFEVLCTCTSGSWQCSFAGSPGQTGDSCTGAGDCGGAKPHCLTVDPVGNFWPGGYCTSQCEPTKNDPQSTLNVACPGAGTCIEFGAGGRCELVCNGTDSPCSRKGYSCWQGVCEPSTIPRSDAGPVTDGGTTDS